MFGNAIAKLPHNYGLLKNLCPAALAGQRGYRLRGKPPLVAKTIEQRLHCKCYYYLRLCFWFINFYFKFSINKILKIQSECNAVRNVSLIRNAMAISFFQMKQKNSSDLKMKRKLSTLDFRPLDYRGQKKLNSKWNIKSNWKIIQKLKNSRDILSVSCNSMEFFVNDTSNYE